MAEFVMHLAFLQQLTLPGALTVTTTMQFVNQKPVEPGVDIQDDDAQCLAEAEWFNLNVFVYMNLVLVKLMSKMTAKSAINTSAEIIK